MRYSIPGVTMLAAFALACSEGSTTPSSDRASLQSGGTAANGAATSISCELRSARSRISVDARNLPSGNYTARVTSGANSATAAARHTVGGEVEFDFDSSPRNIAAGATPIARNFIVASATPDVTGEVVNAAGTVVRSLGANCRIR